MDFTVLEVFHGTIDDSVSLNWYAGDPLPAVGEPVWILVNGNTARLSTDCDDIPADYVASHGYPPGRAHGWPRAHLPELLAGLGLTTGLALVALTRRRRTKTVVAIR